MTDIDINLNLNELARHIRYDASYIFRIAQGNADHLTQNAFVTGVCQCDPSSCTQLGQSWQVALILVLPADIEDERAYYYRNEKLAL